MDHSAPHNPQDTVAQLKDDIDSGRTGDKVATGDPGLSPLGTDGEAGGNPLTPEQISLARQQESRIGSIATAGDRGSTGVMPILVMATVVGAIALVIVIFLATRI